MKENIVLFDSNEKEARDFVKGLNESTKFEWKALICTSNQGRKNWFDDFLRYMKYFIFPLKIFLKRKRYNVIIGWQEFYGLIFAFYCRLFHVNKINKVVIKNFIYKPKKGVLGKIYFRFMNYIATSKYIDIFICASQTNCDFCTKTFNVASHKFVFLPFGVNDFTEWIDTSSVPTNDYVLSIGRSNRDWDILIESFLDQEEKLYIVCDQLKRESPSPNIKIYNNVWGEESYKFIYNCKCMIIPIADGEIASGDTVLLQAMCFSKPIIITKPSCLADDYVEDGINGLIVEKEIRLIKKAVKELFDNPQLCQKLASNSRKLYEEKYSLLSYGINVGKMLLEEKICIHE